MPSRLVELEIPRPGIFGVNTSASGDVMPKEYSVSTLNMVFADEGYLEARRGTRRDHSVTLQSTLGAGSSQTVRSIFYTTDENGADLLIFATEDGIMKISSNTVTDITGTITAPSAGNWKFQNLNNVIIGQQAGHPMIAMTTPSSGRSEERRSSDLPVFVLKIQWPGIQYRQPILQNSVHRSSTSLAWKDVRGKPAPPSVRPHGPPH